MPSYSEEEILKHALRTRVWLPACLRRLAAVRAEFGSDAFLRYFTFSSGDALDPIFLFIANVLEARAASGPEGSQGLTTVHFFNRNADNPQPIVNDLPGARCFGGPFVETVMFDPSAPQPSDPDSDAANRHGLLRASNRRFRQFFPFDVINFDWNDLLLDGSPNPTGVVDALRRIFQWQSEGGDHTRPISAFILSIAVRRPTPQEVSPTAAGAIRTVIADNMSRQSRLAPVLNIRCGVFTVADLAAAHWDDFVELGIPKIILTTLDETGWAIDPSHPMQQFTRPCEQPHGVIQQIILEIIPKTGSMGSVMYGQAVEMLFSQQPIPAQADDRAAVAMSLGDVYARRNMFRDGPPRL